MTRFCIGPGCGDRFGGIGDDFAPGPGFGIGSNCGDDFGCGDDFAPGPGFGIGSNCGDDFGCGTRHAAASRGLDPGMLLRDAATAARCHP